MIAVHQADIVSVAMLTNADTAKESRAGQGLLLGMAVDLAVIRWVQMWVEGNFP